MRSRCPPSNLYEPLFEVTHSGVVWQITPLERAGGRKLVSPSLATASLPSPASQKVAPDESGARWLDVKGAPTGEPLRIVEVIDTLGHEPDKPRYSIVVAGPQDWLDHLVGNFRYRLTTALALAGIGLVAVTLFQVRFGLLPLRQIEHGLAAIRSGAASKLEGELPAEIEPLQSELNALIRSNQDVVDRARTHVGNLAHALKTPLAVITNEARGDKTGLGEKVAEQADIMKQSMTRYLDRARMAARVGVIGRVTPVAPVIEPLVRTLQRIHQDKAVAISVDCPADARFQGEKQDLEEMLGNLLDNACKWGAARRYADRRGAAVDEPRAQSAPVDHRGRRRAGAQRGAAGAHRQARVAPRRDQARIGPGAVNRHGAGAFLRWHVRFGALSTGWSCGALKPPGGLSWVNAIRRKAAGFRPRPAHIRWLVRYTVVRKHKGAGCRPSMRSHGFAMTDRLRGTLPCARHAFLPSLSFRCCCPLAVRRVRARRTQEMIVGGVAGGIIGNQIGKGSGNVLATVAGAVIGGIVGSEIGNSMDQQDRQLAERAEFAALEEGESDRPRRWRNPDNGRYGDVVPSRPYKRSAMDCRDYTHTIYIDGRPRTMRGTACRNPDGTWRNVA